MKTYEEIKALVKELGIKNPMVTRLIGGTKKELQELPKVLHKGEEIYYMTSGLVNGKTWLIVCTDRRVIFLDKGFVYRFEMKEIPLNRINSIQAKKGIIEGSMHIWDGADKTIIKRCYKLDVQPFVAAVHRAKEELMRPNKAKELESRSIYVSKELKELHSLMNEGILSEEEFQREKARILRH